MAERTDLQSLQSTVLGKKNVKRAESLVFSSGYWEWNLFVFVFYFFGLADSHPCILVGLSRTQSAFLRAV